MLEGNYSVEPLNNGHIGAGILSFVRRLSPSQRLTKESHRDIQGSNLLCEKSNQHRHAQNLPKIVKIEQHQLNERLIDFLGAT